MLHIDSAKPLKDKILKLRFKEYAQEYIVNMSEYIESNRDFNLIRELEDDKVFMDFILDHGVIFWSNGFDIAPEYLFFLANKNNPEYKELFTEWGYLA